jgi:hypothetical protein
MAATTSEETNAKQDEPATEPDDRLLGSRRLAAVSKVFKTNILFAKALIFTIF